MMSDGRHENSIAGDENEPGRSTGETVRMYLGADDVDDGSSLRKPRSARPEGWSVDSRATYLGMSEQRFVTPAGRRFRGAALYTMAGLLLVAAVMGWRALPPVPATGAIMRQRPATQNATTFARQVAQERLDGKGRVFLRNLLAPLGLVALALFGVGLIVDGGGVVRDGVGLRNGNGRAWAAFGAGLALALAAAFFGAAGSVALGCGWGGMLASGWGLARLADAANRNRHGESPEYETQAADAADRMMVSGLSWCAAGIALALLVALGSMA